MIDVAVAVVAIGVAGGLWGKVQLPSRARPATGFEPGRSGRSRSTNCAAQKLAPAPMPTPMPTRIRTRDSTCHTTRPGVAPSAMRMPDFSAATIDGVRRDTVQPNRRQQQRKPAEESREDRERPFERDRPAHGVRQRLKAQIQVGFTPAMAAATARVRFVRPADRTLNEAAHRSRADGLEGHDRSDQTPSTSSRGRASARTGTRRRRPSRRSSIPSAGDPAGLRT